MNKKSLLQKAVAAALSATLVLQAIPSLVLAADPSTQGSTPVYASEDKVLKLWYDEPAEESNSGWESQSLPLGNGYMGANVFGGVESELISITENSLANPYGTGSNDAGRPSSNREGLNTFAKTYIDFGNTETDPVVANVTGNAESANPKETMANLFDGNKSTKYYSYTGTEFPVYVTVEYDKAMTFNQYTITSGNDSQPRDPKNWNLYGSNDGEIFELLDTQTDITFDSRKQDKTFTLEDTVSYKYIKYEITDNKDGDIDTGIQLSEISFTNSDSSYNNYQRYLDLNNAIAGVSYDQGGVTYTREYFTSYPDKVMVMKLSASEEGRLDFTLRPEIPFVKDYLTKPGDGKGKTGKVVADTESNDLITLSGTMNYYNINYEGQYKVITDGGNMVASNDENEENGKITVTGANSAVIILAVGTNYHMTPEVFTAPDKEKLDPDEYPHDKVSQYIADASAKSYDELKETHLADYKSYFDRAKLNLGGEFSDTVTTDQLLANYKNGNYDPYLEELVFQYGRYLLIASSREGCLPPNLQGVWNYYESTPWSGGYWHNINQQMNYWPAFNTNLVDLFEPYAEFNEAFRKAAENNADQYLKSINAPTIAEAGTGENGWAIGTGVWPYRAEAPSATGHSGPGVGAFTSILFWDYYDFTRDEGILEEHTYPAIESMAKFLSKTLEEQEDGKWLVYNSASPENASNYRTVGCAFDQQMIYENHKDVLKAAELLGIEDSEILTTIREQIDHLDPVNIGYSGQIKEYREENYYGEIGEYQHRHISQLVGLYPGTFINSETDAWMDAAKVSLTYRGDGTTGWSIGHRLNAWARAKDGNHSYQVLQKLLKTKLMNNLWDTHPPFQIDGNFGATAGIGEMLVQGHEGYIAPLPALPDAWATGSYSGLTTRGNFEVGADWLDGQATKFTIKSNAGSDCSVKYYNIADATIVDSQGNPVEVTTDGTDMISFPTTEGETYTITNIPAYEETAAPSNLQLSNSGTSMQLNWTGSEDAVSYNVYRAVNDAATYELIASDVTDTSYTYMPTDLAAEDQVTLRVTAVAENGRESEGITALSLPLEAPDSVTGFYTSDTTLQLNVSAVDAAESYNVYKNDQLLFNTPYTTIVVADADSTATYSVSTVSNGRESDKTQAEISDSATLENILLNKPLTASSNVTVFTPYPLSNAVNGTANPSDADDRWAVNDFYGSYTVTADLQGTYPLGTLNIMEWISDTLPTRSPNTKVEVLNSDGEWQTIKEGFALQAGEYVPIDMGGVLASQIRITFDNQSQFRKAVCITEMTCSSAIENPADKAELFDVLQEYGSIDIEGKVLDSSVREYTTARDVAVDALNNMWVSQDEVDAAAAKLREVAVNVTNIKDNVFLNQSVSTNVPALNSTFAVNCLVDGDVNTRFAAIDNGNNVIATIDLKENYTFDAFYVQEYLNIGTQTRSKETTIEVFDGTDWNTVVDKQALSSTPDQEKDTHTTTEFKLDQPVTGSQVRFTFVNNENKRITIYELQAAGEKVTEPTEEANKTNLKFYLDKANAVDSSVIESLVESAQAQFETALTNGQKVYDDPAATQEEVNAAAKELRIALNMLSMVAGNKDALNDLISEAEDLIANAGNDYPQSAIDELQKAIDAAKEVANDGDAFQADVDKAVNDLQDAMEAFQNSKLDWRALEAAVADAANVAADKDNYVNDETAWEAFDKAYAAAQNMLESKTADSQEAIDEVTTALLEASSNLRYKADKDTLNKVITDAETVDVTLYTASSVAMFRSALAAANTVLADESLSVDDQAVVDNAATALEEAMAALVPVDQAIADGGDNTTGSADTAVAGGGEDSTTTTAGTAKTGDTNPVPYVIIVICAAVILIVAAVVLKKRKSLIASHDNNLSSNGPTNLDGE